MNKLKYVILGFGLAVAIPSLGAIVSYYGSGSADQLGVALHHLLKGESETLNRMMVTKSNTCRVITADSANITTGVAGVLDSITVEGHTANDDIVVYDNTAASGTKIFELLNMTAGMKSVNDLGAVFSTGLSIDVTLTGGSVTYCYF